jgi:hypothetical protein
MAVLRCRPQFTVDIEVALGRFSQESRRAGRTTSPAMVGGIDSMASRMAA